MYVNASLHLGKISGEDLFFGLHLNLGQKSSIFGEDLFFWSSPEFTEKKSSSLVKTFFLGLHLICSPEKGSSPPMSNLGQNWGKIANYLPQCSTKICTPDCELA